MASNRKVAQAKRPPFVNHQHVFASTGRASARTPQDAIHRVGRGRDPSCYLTGQR